MGFGVCQTGVPGVRPVEEPGEGVPIGQRAAARGGEE
jgi:hypothetical protein